MPTIIKKVFLDLNAISAHYLNAALKMNAASFYAKQAGVPQTRAPSVDTDDSCLSDSEERLNS